MLFDLSVGVILSVVRECVKNPARKKALQLKLLNIAAQINALYASEE